MFKFSIVESDISASNALAIILIPAYVNVLELISNDLNFDYIIILQILFADLSVILHEDITNLEINERLNWRDKHDTPISPILIFDRLRIFNDFPCVII